MLKIANNLLENLLILINITKKDKMLGRSTLDKIIKILSKSQKIFSKLINVKGLK